MGLYFQIHAKNIRHDEVCGFLTHLLRHLRGHVIVIWDNASIHKGDRIREVCARFPRLHLVYLPPYAPELNPDEGVWALAKQPLANGRPDELLFEAVARELPDHVEPVRLYEAYLRNFEIESGRGSL